MMFGKKKETIHEPMPTKIVNISGREDMLLPYLLAKVCASMKYKTLLIDNTEEHALYTLLTGMKTPDPEIISVQGMDVMCDVMPAKDDEYELVFVYSAGAYHPAAIKNIDHQILVLSWFKSEEETIVEKMIKPACAHLDGKAIVLLPGKPSRKIHENEIVKDTGIKPFAVLTSSMDVMDAAALQAFEYNAKAALKNVSEEYRQMVEEVAGYLLDADEKTIRKYGVNA